MRCTTKKNGEKRRKTKKGETRRKMKKNGETRRGDHCITDFF